MHSWRWFDQWISSSGRGEESYLFFLRHRREVTRVSQWAKSKMHPILNPRWEMQGRRARNAVRRPSAAAAVRARGSVWP